MVLKVVTFDEQDLRKIIEPETFGRKLKRTGIRTVKQLLGLALLFVFFFALINGGAFWTRLRYSLAAQPTTAPAPPQIIELPKPVVNYSPEVFIPAINITAPLAINVQPSQVIAQLQNGVVHYADTALPGEVGNTVVVGHSSDYPWSTGKFKNVFALLDKLVKGDRIIVPYGSQKFTYEITDIKVVPPTDLSILRRSDEPRLTLITCYPVGTSRKRLIVIAKLVEGETTGTQTTEPLIDELPRAR